jgi:lipase chaperone LimK
LNKKTALKGFMATGFMVVGAIVIAQYSGVKIINPLASPDVVITQFNGEKTSLSVTEVVVKSPQQAYAHFQKEPPTYLNGTDIRGAFHLDSQGKLIVSRSIKQRFDYFFLMTEDKTLTEILNVIAGHLQDELQEPALSSAQRILENYTEYFHQYNKLMTQQEGLSQNDVHWLSEQITQLRHQTLGQEISDIFFAKEDALRQQALNAIADHDGQSQLSKHHEIPAHITKNQEKTLSYITSKKILNKALNENKSPQQIQQLREELYGHDAAQRLKKLDEKRSQWQVYVQRYQQLKQQLTASGISNLDIKEQINESLKHEYQLTDLQIKRLQSLDRIKSDSAS